MMSDLLSVDGMTRWRCIGPFRGGRVVTVAGDPHNPAVFYFGACAGGVWKTTDAGNYWECISDGYFKTGSVGALAVSEADSNVIYAGMGEATIRIDVSHGDGVYKSTDAGRTWQHMGLADTRHIGKIRIHPENPDIVYVAALGHAFGENSERGVYKSTDGGETWRQVLFQSERAGAIDLSIDPNNPRIIYAAIWEAQRSFWNIKSGGPDSGLWKSTDGGETWENISQNTGLPEGPPGKIGVVASPAKPGRVWAIIEAKKGGVYRSDDYGETWEYIADDERLISRAWYYMHLTADPQDGDTLYINNLSLWKSTDGGKTYTEISTPHGDNHDLWIDPANPQRMVQGNDGGACVSFNGGESWSTLYNQPTAQYYHIALDTRKPYNIYGTQQDNSSLAVPSRSPNSSITWTDCFLAGTGESGYVAVRPDDPDIVYVGAIGSSPGGGNALQRYDHRTKQVRLITTWPEVMSGHGAGEHKYRFAWTYPIILSPHDPNILYVGGNVVQKSTDEGQSWQDISPDLTRAEPETLKASGTPINRDAVGAETYATVYSLMESPHEAGVLWAGSDDGLVHVTKDGGETWTDVTPPDFQKYTMVTMLEASPTDAGTVYMAATRYKVDDYAPYLYKTTDYGATWQRINAGIPDDDFTRVIRCDPQREGLLYAGTETGLYLSFDDGETWQRFQLNLPVAPIYDIRIKGDDLVVATHGRSLWILDDLNAIRQYSPDISDQDAFLVKPRDSQRILPKIFEGLFGGAPGKNYMATLGIVAAYMEDTDDDNNKSLRFLDSGENPPKGVVVSYYLKEQPSEPITLRFQNENGETVREFRSMTDADRTAREASPDAPKEPFIPAKAGWNRFIWDMREDGATRLVDNDPQAGYVPGPMVVPGVYQVTLSAAGQNLTESFWIIQDDFSEAAPDDLQAQYDLMRQIRDMYSQTAETINNMRAMRKRLKDWTERLANQNGTQSLSDEASRLHDAVLDLERELLYPELKPGWPGMLNHGMQLIRKLAALPSVVECGDYRPTDQAVAVYDHLSSQIQAVLDRFQALQQGDLAVWNQKLKDSDLPVVGI